MFQRDYPVPGLLLAVFGAGIVGMVAESFWLALAMLVVWAGSLFLDRSRPEAQPAPAPNALFQTDRMRDFLEPLGLPYLVMERGRILLANRAAREVLGAHVIGQDARVALRHPEAVKLIDEEAGGQALIRGLTGPRSIWHIAMLPIDAGTTMIELVNRTAEADISRAHTDFVANASHELRTPLASIIGYVETLIDSDDPDPDPGSGRIPAEKRRQFYRTVLKEGKRLQALVEDLMSLSRIEAEKHELPAAVFDLGELARLVVSSMASLHGATRVVLKREEGAMPMRGDRQQIDQLLRNLVDNGLKYGAPDQPVTVAARTRGHHLELAVSDKGAGIAREHLPHLTRRFYRTDPGRSRAVGGTGLGLAIVKHIVERHRGRLDIRSRPGEGTTVAIRLPRQDEDEDKDRATSASKTAKG